MSILQAIVSIDDVWDSVPLPQEDLKNYPLCGGKETIQSPGFHLMDVNCEKEEIEAALRKVSSWEIMGLNRLADILERLPPEELSRFAAECGALKRPNLEGLTSMAEIRSRPTVTMTLDEMCVGLDERIAQDRKIMTACAEGIIQYATDLAKADPLALSARIPQLRTFLERMMPYWGLEEGEPGVEDRILDAFDQQTTAARSGNAVPETTNQHKTDAAHGLYCYGGDLVCSMGEDALEDISNCIELLKEITWAWDFESHITEGWVAALNSDLERLKMSAPGAQQMPG